MKIWVDAQLSPAQAQWLSKSLRIEATALRDLGLRDEADSSIFFAAREAGVIVMTNDRDFADLVHLHGAPPQVVWLTCGNTSNVHLQRILTEAWPAVQEMLRNGERLVEIGG